MRYVRRRRRDPEGSDAGFTLIELLVVLLIIGILLGIAVPTYLSVTGGAKTNAAESNLQTALTGMKSIYATQLNGSYLTGSSSASTASTTLATDLGAAGTDLTYNTTGSSNASTVYVDVVDANQAVLVNSDATNCYAIADIESGNAAAGTTGTGTMASGTYWATWPASGSACTTPASGLSWSATPQNPAA